MSQGSGARRLSQFQSHRANDRHNACRWRATALAGAVTPPRLVPPPATPGHCGWDGPASTSVQTFSKVVSFFLTHRKNHIW